MAYGAYVDERYEVRPWFSSRHSEGSSGRALVLPGAGYTVDHPALFWACQVLAQVGWRVVTMRWRADNVAEAERRDFVEQGADLLDAEAGPGPRTLVLAKSLGSYAAAWASDRGYPAVWLTPVLTDELVADALRSYSAPSLLIGGTADPLWSTPAVAAADQQILELKDVDHALHRAGDWRASLAALGSDVDRDRGVRHPRRRMTNWSAPGLN
jgi:hypothetical protein